MIKIKKYIIFILMSILIFGCSGKFDYIIKENPVRPKISEDKALVFILRPSFIGFMVPFRVYLDNKPIGLTKGKTYFFFYASAGKHILKTVAGNTTEIELTLVSGKKYYIKQNIILDKIAPKNNAVLISEEEGEEIIKSTKMLFFIKLPNIIK
ncbi:MAG: DUF2846 domain-containing protein [Candidatus Firestonebacteria bacterium]|nr:DUF2846 domain-containing protein [Candidatus Firestonebacteria bacterium]